MQKAHAVVRKPFKKARQREPEKKNPTERVDMRAAIQTSSPFAPETRLH